MKPFHWNRNATPSGSDSNGTVSSFYLRSVTTIRIITQPPNQSKNTFCCAWFLIPSLVNSLLMCTLSNCVLRLHDQYVSYLDVLMGAHINKEISCIQSSARISPFNNNSPFFKALQCKSIHFIKLKCFAVMDLILVWWSVQNLRLHSCVDMVTLAHP